MPKTLEIQIAPGQLLEILWQDDNPGPLEPALRDDELTLTFTVPAHLKRVEERAPVRPGVGLRLECLRGRPAVQP